MKMLILGHGNHGKTDVAAFLKKITGLNFVDSSWSACLNAVWPHMKDKYATPALCHADRRNHREFWYQKICEYNTPDKARLTKDILRCYDGYVGMRDDGEFRASVELFDIIMWVDASQRMPEDDTMKIEYDPRFMVRIDNNGTFDETAATLVAWARERGLCE